MGCTLDVRRQDTLECAGHRCASSDAAASCWPAGSRGFDRWHSPSVLGGAVQWQEWRGSDDRDPSRRTKEEMLGQSSSSREAIWENRTRRHRDAENPRFPEPNCFGGLAGEQGGRLSMPAISRSGTGPSVGAGPGIALRIMMIMSCEVAPLAATPQGIPAPGSPALPGRVWRGRRGSRWRTSGAAWRG